MWYVLQRGKLSLRMVMVVVGVVVDLIGAYDY